MAAIFGILSLLGWLVCVVGSIMVLIKAFQKSILWGLGSLLVPFVILFFVVLNWEESKQGFLIAVAGMVAAFILALLAGVFGGGAVEPVAMMVGTQV